MENVSLIPTDNTERRMSAQRPLGQNLCCLVKKKKKKKCDSRSPTK